MVKRFFVGLVAVVMAFLPASVSALTEEQLDMFAQNNILFYDPNGVDCTYMGGLTSTNANYAGAEVWSMAELQAVQANKAIYEQAANKYGFPWQILAVLHKKGNNLQRSNPASGQGVYRPYPDALLIPGTDIMVDRKFTPEGEISEDEFRQQTLIAAEIVNNKAAGLDLNDLDNVKKLFFEYSGGSALNLEYMLKAAAMGFSPEQAANGEGSPYVMNRFDSQRDPTGTAMNPLWSGRYEMTGLYVDTSVSYLFGAFVMYTALGGGGGEYCTGGQGLPIFQTAMNLAKLGDNNGTGNWTNDKVPNPEYEIALRSYGAATPCRDSANGDCAPLGASCDQFVATVMIYSGADPDFPKINPPAQQRYMEGHPEKYQKIANVRDSSLLQPGDIFVADAGEYRHIFIYGGERNGVQVQIGASYNQHTAQVYNFYNSWTYHGVDYSIYRKI